MLLALFLLLAQSLPTLTVHHNVPTSLRILASDNTFVARVDFLIDNKLLRSLPGASSPEPFVSRLYSVPWTPPRKRGSHTLTVIVTDAAGNSTTLVALILVQ